MFKDCEEYLLYFDFGPIDDAIFFLVFLDKTQELHQFKKKNKKK